MSYAESGAKMATLADLPRRMTLRETLVERKKQFEERLAEVESALAFIDKNPEFENFHNLIGKVGY